MRQRPRLSDNSDPVIASAATQSVDCCFH